MSGTDATVLSALVMAASGVLVGLFTLYDNRKTKREQRELREEEQRHENEPQLKQIEAAAYGRAKESYETALRNAREESERLAQRLQQFEERTTRIEEAARLANTRAERAEEQVEHLRRIVVALRYELRKANVPIPAHLDGDGE